MPNIDEYNPATPAIRPSDMGAESAARAAYRIGSYGNQQAADLQRVGQEVGQGVRQLGDVALQYMEHREINTAAPHAATISASKDQAWSNYISGKDIDPNDPTRQDQISARVNNPQAAQQWREENLDPDLDKFQQAFMTQGGQRWAQDWADKYRNHFTVMAHADQATMAGEVVKANIEKTGNTLATGVFNNPSTLGASFDLLDHSIEGNVRSSPTMTPDVATRVTTELKQANEEKLVQAAVQGAILKGGDWHNIANDPKYAPYIKPAENAAFERQEKFYQKGIEASERQTIATNKEIAELNAGTDINQSWTKNVTYDQTSGAVRINPQFMKDMVELPLKNPNAPNAATMAEAKLDWAISKQGAQPTTRDDPNATASIIKLLSDPTTTQSAADIAIDKASTAKSFTDKTEANLRKLAGDMNELKDPALEKVMDGAKDIVEPKYEGVDLNPGAYGAFYFNFINNQYLPAKRAGTLPPNALDLNDPKSMISLAVSSFKPNLPQMIGANGGLGAPALPVYTAPAKTAAPVQVGNKADYDKLAPGTVFTHNGKQFVKPQGGPQLPPGSS